jgi:hypothetical protein
MTAEPGLLGIYLNDHLAGATAGVELFQRATAPHRGSALGEVLERITAEVVEDRAALLDIMDALDVPVRHYKLYAAWAAEKIGRLKLNGHLLSRSPLSTLIELEGLRLGVEGKAAGWRTLRRLADRDSRLRAERLDGLLARAQQQIDTLEELRITAAAEVFGAA